MDAAKLYKGIGPCSGERSLPGSNRVVWCASDGKLEELEVCDDPEIKKTKNLYQFHKNDTFHEEKGCSHVM